MGRNRIRLAFVLVIIIAVIAVVVWQVLGTASSESSADILSSGFIEARDVSISLETGGRIVDIAADEGDSVDAGMPLVRLDDSLLRAQRQQAEATVAIHQADLEKVIAALSQATISRDAAERIWKDALEVQNNPLELESKIIVARGELAMAEIAIEVAWEGDFSPKKWGRVEEKRANLRRDIAQNVLDNLLEIRENPQEINSRVDETYAAYQSAVAAVEVAEQAVEVAKAWVEQAEASLHIIDVQLSRLTSSSPISGVVAARYAEVGEIAQPSAPILNITELNKVTLTTYVPESKIGLVKLGQEAIVSVDSYPQESFTGKVVYISPQAVFTPKNIQLREEREKMVFAIKIRLDNPEHKLKPGMPADAKILTNTGG